jgi:hypothetical protein
MNPDGCGLSPVMTSKILLKPLLGETNSSPPEKTLRSLTRGFSGAGGHTWDDISGSLKNLISATLCEQPTSINNINII